MFLTIVSVSDVPRGGVQVLFGHIKNNKALPLNPACFEHLNVWSPASLLYILNIAVSTSEWELLIFLNQKKDTIVRSSHNSNINKKKTISLTLGFLNNK
jgi:hypothetical protein